MHQEHVCAVCDHTIKYAMHQLPRIIHVELVSSLECFAKYMTKYLNVMHKVSVTDDEKEIDNLESIQIYQNN